MDRANAESNLPKYVVLVSVALDETADWALHEAARLARAPNAELHLVHVIAQTDSTSSADLKNLDRSLEAAPKALQQRIEKVWQAGDAQQIIAHIRPGQDAASVIVQAATDVGADILVVGTHRRKGLGKLVLGSVAERVLREAHCPVLVALPKDYAGQAKSDSIEPACPDCVRVRGETGNRTYWCERHSRSYMQPHVYEPMDHKRGSVMPAT